MPNDVPPPNQQPAPTPDELVARRWRAFLVWASILTALWAFANWPRAPLGPLKSFFVFAGLPWPFAHWERGQLEWFRPAALAADVAVWAGLMLLAWLCAWSRTRRGRQDVSGKAG
jgi:hypothetical protein